MTWSKTRIRYVASLNPAAPEWVSSHPDDEFSFLPMEAIGEDASIRLDQTRPVNAVSSGYSFFEDGDVAFAKVTPCFENGKAAVMSGLVGGAGFGTTEITVARPNNKILNRFLFYVLTDDTFRQLGKSAMTGAGGLKRVPDLFTKDYSFVMPPTDEQHYIVDFLDRETAQIDDLIVKQERLIELLAEKRQAVITQAVTKGLDPDAPTKPSGVPWQDEVPAHWTVQPLKNLMQMQTGVTLGKDYTDVETESFAYLRVANVQIGFVNLSDVKEIELPVSTAQSSLLRAGDVLMTEGGDRDKLGRGCIWNGEINPCVHQNHIFAVRTNKQLLNEFLVLALDADPARTYFYLTGKQSTNLASTNSTTVKNFRFGAPPIHEQQLIVEHLRIMTSQIDNLVGKATSVVAILRERRSALISAAVTGKIDVPEGVA